MGKFVDPCVWCLGKPQTSLVNGLGVLDAASEEGRKQYKLLKRLPVLHFSDQGRKRILPL